MTDSSSPSIDDRLAGRLVAAAGDAIIVADREGQIILWNRGAETMFGHPAAAALGQTLDLIIPEGLRGRHWDGYHQTMRTGETRYAGELLAVPGVRSDGRRLSLEFTVTLLDGPDGHPEAIAAVIRDVTARWQSERAVQAELRQLREQVGPTSGDGGSTTTADR